jgi:hypothetical protein
MSAQKFLPPQVGLTFEERWDEISAGMFKCQACFCAEQGCTNPVNPMCLVDNKSCCCRQTCETTDCCGDKGLISDIEKYCCIVNSCSLTPACGCCNMWLFGRPHGEGMEHQDGDGGDEFMTGVFWLSYCVFMGTGVTAISPCIYADQKWFCLECQTRTMDCGGEGGCCHSRKKSCCAVMSSECPPTMEIGCAFCGCKCCGGDKSEARGAGPQQQKMTS